MHAVSQSFLQFFLPILCAVLVVFWQKVQIEMITAQKCNIWMLCFSNCPLSHIATLWHYGEWECGIAPCRGPTQGFIWTYLMLDALSGWTFCYLWLNILLLGQSSCRQWWGRLGDNSVICTLHCAHYIVHTTSSTLHCAHYTALYYALHCLQTTLHCRVPSPHYRAH